LRLAWDTNVLIDWRDYGQVLLADDEALPTGLEPAHHDELIALGAVMNSIYLTRDIRIIPLTRQLRDLGSRRGSNYRRRAEERARQLDEVASALWCVGLARELRAGRHSPGSWWRADFMRSSPDRLLVEEAVTRGCHAFLTRDKKILARAPQIRELGLVAVSPTRLLDEVVLSDDMASLYGSDGMLCDNHKYIHLERAAQRADVRGDGPPSDIGKAESAAPV
jgi:hypothetical protein